MGRFSGLVYFSRRKSACGWVSGEWRGISLADSIFRSKWGEERGWGCVPKCPALTPSVLSLSEVTPILSLSGILQSEAASGVSQSLVKFLGLRRAKPFAALLLIFHCFILWSPPFSFFLSLWDYEFIFIIFQEVFWEGEGENMFKTAFFKPSIPSILRKTRGRPTVHQAPTSPLPHLQVTTIQYLFHGIILRSKWGKAR